MRPNITPAQSLENVAILLETSKDVMVKSDNPFVNEQLKELLKGLYDVQKNAGVLTIPVVLDLSNMSTSALIETLITQTRKTNALVAVATELEVKQQSKKVIASNESQMEKLKQASESAKEAKELSDGLGIFKWVMFALSVILTVVSAIATIATFGGAAKLLVASLIVLSISTAFLIAGSVPVDDENHSAMDLASEKMAVAIENQAKNDLKASYGARWDKMSDEEQQEVFNEAQETGAYGSMGFFLAINVVVAAVLIAVSLGGSFGTSASMVVNGATRTADTGARAALDTSKQFLMQNLPTIIKATRTASSLGQFIKAGGTIAQSGVNIEASVVNLDSKEAQTEAQLLQAYAKYLMEHEEVLIGLIGQLNDTTAESYRTVANILKDAHQQNRQVISGFAGASAV